MFPYLTEITLLFFTCRLGGSVYVAGRSEGFGLAAQEPWIQHATVRDNILFGRDFDSTFYQAVIEACALSDDLNVRHIFLSVFCFAALFLLSVLWNQYLHSCMTFLRDLFSTFKY